MSDYVIEKEYGWVIFYQSKEYIQTNNFNSILVGSGGILVEKATGNTYEFGSAYSTEQNLQIYELGYLQYENWDIEVIKVINKSRTIEHLSKLHIQYVVPEKEHGIVWVIPKEYSPDHIRHKLNSLPVRFNLNGVYLGRWEVLESFKKQNDFEYQLFENKGYENSI